MANKREIVERVQYRIEDETGRFLGSSMLETVLTAAGYFDLLEMARDVVVQHRYTSSMDNHEKVYCLECHQEWHKHESTCSTGALLEILRKAGVEVD